MRLLVRLALVALLAALPAAAAETSPYAVSHQGRLLNGEDQPVNGAVDLTMTLWDAPEGGTQKWTQVFSKVQVVNGFYSLVLGDGGKQLTAADLAGPRWLAVGIDGTTLSPRQRVGVAPLAVRADSAGNADTLGGKTLADLDARYAPASGGGYVQVNPASPQAGALSLTGDVTTAGKFVGDGSRITAVDAAKLGGQALADLDARYVAARQAGYVQLSPATAQAGTISVTGDVTTAGKFIGDGSQLTNLPVSSLPTNLAKVDAANAFTGANSFGGATSFGNTTTFGGAATFQGAANFQGAASFAGTGQTGFAGDVKTSGKFLGDGSGLTGVVAARMPVASARPTSGVAAGTFLFNTTTGTIDLYDGSTWRTFAQQAPVSCAAIKAANASAADGLYFIAPPGVGLLSVWCDMTTSGGGWTGVFQYNFNGNEGGPSPTMMQTVTGTPGQASNYTANGEGVFAAIGATQMLVKETIAGSTTWVRFNSLSAAQFNNIWNVSGDGSWAVTTSTGANCSANSGNHGHGSGVVQFNNGSTANAATVFEFNSLTSTRDTNHYWHVWPACNGTFAINEGVAGARMGAVFVK